ncbi:MULTISPECIES: alcohol dehydrogenase catalytic domain-containing protein [Chloracidobacterium]|jgi:L-iditol 2-dehydrogenase|uniref:Threonine dehydrogenase-like Zn-dependent dehydrogenase n=1 Tax=Chloracidobacterium thermophilum (strain B) TaxID=981222 RepID=G2LIG1_CHLTF|nr:MULTISPECIES: alcohol dehydrogenase catalytic domain-containing protein [Chloracidobacterium]AEP11859.1 Threonine dehydrogenase-like Zn-dependent dehydrogenase [Chloracidobacterium thermophilum B]QUV79722.1 alcohol dehydrogenase catalytic domain-containing protein [Chloracidobacterium thermophilum]QUV82757.1 alcohol dehydrogenase catalytic domain-containing protein [Chloracidobacterium sp. D]
MTALMKVARVYDFDDIRIEHMPRPSVGPRELLVQVKASGICSGDVTPWYIKRKAGKVLGHEPAGIVAEVGAEVTGFRVGDPVFAHHHAPCFNCKFCEKGEYVQCATWKASHIVPGAIAEYFLVPEVNLRDTLRLPEGMSFEDGALVEPAACSVKAIRKARLHPRDTVLIIGLGIMGQMNVLLARQAGVERIIGADLVDWRCAKALEFGADAVINPAREDLVERLGELTAGAMADVVIVGPGSVPVMELGIRCAGKGGTVVFFMGSSPGERLTVEPFHLYFNEIDLVMSYSCGPDDTRAALQYIAEGVLTAEKLVTHRYTLEDTGLGFRKMAEAQDVLKAQIIFP